MSRTLLPLAGFQVITIGRFWVIAEEIELRARLGVTDRYNQGNYPLAEFAAARSFGILSPYIKVTNITNTGYEEIEGVRMPGRTYIAGLELRLTREHAHK